ncbi:MAG: hypothetical protein RLY87_2684 [Chloroflexota bacterium]
MALSKLLTHRQVAIIDGALATELERNGADLQHTLWSAKYLLSEPDRIKDVHRAYLESGAQILITASYQATVPGFLEAGYNEADALSAITRSVTIARDARTEWATAHPNAEYWPLIAGSVGPYGAYTADGGEYRGNYGLSREALIAFHLPRIRTLIAAGVDLIACETIPDLVEADALASCISQFPRVSCWMSMSCRNGTETNAGQTIAEVAVKLNQYACVTAIGVNCTAPQHITSLVTILASQTTKPIVVYPNSGESYDATSKTWSGTVTCADYVTAAASWVNAGARIVGGCCRTTPEHIRALVNYFQSVPTPRTGVA